MDLKPHGPLRVTLVISMLGMSLGVCRNHSRVRVVPQSQDGRAKNWMWLKEARPHTYCTVQTVSSGFCTISPKNSNFLTNPMHDGGEGPPSPQAASFFLFFLSLLVSDLFLEQIFLNLDVKVTVGQGVPLSDPRFICLRSLGALNTPLVTN